MPLSVISVHAQGQVRGLSELIGMLAHRRAQVSSICASFDDDGCRVQIAVETANEAVIDLLVKRLNRIVGVIEVVHQRDDCVHRQPDTADRTREAMRTRFFPVGASSTAGL